jgi:hypothetical protein
VKAILMLLVMALPVVAHHSVQAEFDLDKPITISGKVTKVESTLRRFGVQSLAKLRILVRTEFVLGQEPSLTPAVWNLALDDVLSEMAGDFRKYGDRGDKEPVKTLNSTLNRHSAQRTPNDWEFLVDLS